MKSLILSRAVKSKLGKVMELNRLIHSLVSLSLIHSLKWRMSSPSLQIRIRTANVTGAEIGGIEVIEKNVVALEISYVV